MLEKLKLPEVFLVIWLVTTVLSAVFRPDTWKDWMMAQFTAHNGEFFVLAVISYLHRRRNQDDDDTP